MRAVTRVAVLASSIACLAPSTPLRAGGSAAAQDVTGWHRLEIPGGRATLPTRMTWAPPAGSEPVGASALSASELDAGRLVPSPSRIGAWTGAAISTEAAIAAYEAGDAEMGTRSDGAVEPR